MLTAVLLIPDLGGWRVSLGFVIGAVLSAAAGFIGMNVAVRANVRTAEAARNGLPPAMSVAFKGGTVTGILVISLGMLGVAGYYGALRAGGVDQNDAIRGLIGLGFGGSLISVFARVGGGIFTKGADVGADLVGKIEAGIPEDDPRNPAVIADNVGDNVGDDAGMAADLFETYAVTIVAAMLLLDQFTTGTPGSEAIVGLPLVLAGLSGLASIVGTLLVRVREGGSIINALYIGVLVSAVISAVLFLPAIASVGKRFDEAGEAFATITTSDIIVCALVGLAVTALLMAITEYYTGTRFKPVKDTAEASTTGHATNIIAGLGYSMQATAGPVVVIGAGILIANKLAGLPGITFAVVVDALDGRRHHRARRVRPRHGQRGRHRRDGEHARGSAQQGHRPARRRRQHHQGRHQGLRDRLGRPRRTGAVRLLPRRAESQAAPRPGSHRSWRSTSATPGSSSAC